MVREIDKNDVDISQLFRWKKEIELVEPIMDVHVTAYMRLVGDADLGRARAYGYRKSAELRRKLQEEGSDERLAFMAEIDDFQDKEVMIQSITLLRLGDYYAQAVKEVVVPEPKEPDSDAPQEQWEKYQAAVDAYPEKHQKAVADHVEKSRKKAEESVRNMKDKDIYALYETEVRNRLCLEEMQNAYYDMCVYLSMFKDENYEKKAFKSFDDYNNSHPELKTRLRGEYRDLELGTDFLKKLPEATD